MCEFSVHYVALTEKYGRPIYHYHLHVVALPVVEKQIKWSKRCKDKALVGTVKETVMQVSHSKKWKLPQLTDENGVPQFMQTANQYSFQPIAFCKTNSLSICKVKALRILSVENAVAMLTACPPNNVIQVEYPWHHPQRDKVTVRCSGRCVEKNDEVIVFEGFHRVISDF